MLADAPVSYLFIHVIDVDRSLVFYRDVLGLPAVFHEPGLTAFVRTAGGLMLGIYPADATTPVSAGTWLLAFDVPDLETPAQQLRKAGVEVGAIEAVPGGRVVKFCDPDGHRLELHTAA
jgi:predicted enzyme related to lactoylglutathione lyase